MSWHLRPVCHRLDLACLICTPELSLSQPHSQQRANQRIACPQAATGRVGIAVEPERHCHIYFDGSFLFGPMIGWCVCNSNTLFNNCERPVRIHVWHLGAGTGGVGLLWLQ